MRTPTVTGAAAAGADEIDMNRLRESKPSLLGYYSAAEPISPAGTYNCAVLLP